MGGGSELAEYVRGYRDGWYSIRSVDPIRQPPEAIPDGAIGPGQTSYQAGYEQGRATAGGK